MQGELPIVVDGEVIGAIGTNFDTTERDVKIAQAGVAAVPDCNRAPPMGFVVGCPGFHFRG